MSNTHGNLTVHARAASGKGVARKLRAAGRIPAVIYGQGKDNVLVSVSPRELRHAMDPARRLNTFWSLEIQGEDGKPSGSESCIIADLQMDKVRDEFLHVDFLRVDVALEVETKIPVEYSGRPVGVVAGGKLRTLRRTVKIAAKPNEIPVKLHVDVTDIESGSAKRLRDLEIENARFLELPETVMALVEAPRGKKEETPES